MVEIPIPGSFEQGAVPSAAFHFNALTRAADTILSYYAQPVSCFTEYAASAFHQNDDAVLGRTEDGWWRVWSGALRRKYPWETYLRIRGYYNVDVVRGLQVRVQLGDVTQLILDVASGSNSNWVYFMSFPSSWVTETFRFLHIDVRAKSAPYDQLGQSYFRVREVAEYAGPYALTLPPFTGGVPTTADWDMLRTAIITLTFYASLPRIPFLSAIVDPGRNYSIIWRGELEHRFRYVYYDVRIPPPYPTGTVTVFLRVWTGSGEVLFNLGSRSATHFLPAPHAPDEGDAEYTHFTHRGLLDLQSIPNGTYRARVEFTLTDGAQWAIVKLYNLWAYPSRNWILSGWQNMPIFTRGTVVSSANVKPIRDNLQLLLNTMHLINRACPRCYVGKTGHFWNVRTLRYLHYYCMVGEGERRTPQIAYYDGVGWQEVNLPFAPNEWKVYDLETITRLFPGTIYRLKDVDFALEDVTP